MRIVWYRWRGRASGRFQPDGHRGDRRARQHRCARSSPPSCAMDVLQLGRHRRAGADRRAPRPAPARGVPRRARDPLRAARWSRSMSSACRSSCAALVTSLNALLARVRAAAEAQQKIVADAAHQLRTPLAGMQAQLAAPRARVRRHCRCATVSEALHEGRIRRLAHTARQLLTLARAEGSATLERDFVRGGPRGGWSGRPLASHLDRALGHAASTSARNPGRRGRRASNGCCASSLTISSTTRSTTRRRAGIVTLRCGRAAGRGLPRGRGQRAGDSGGGAAARGCSDSAGPRRRRAWARVSGLRSSATSSRCTERSSNLCSGAGGVGTRARVEFGAAWLRVEAVAERVDVG